MKITIVMGFFLPMPPVSGGATEKSWHRLGIEFARCGHEVTIISRQWRNWPHDETIEGVRYIRLASRNHTQKLSTNLWRDFWWSRQVSRALPPADVTVVNCIALPVWLGRFRGNAGKLVVMTGRMPKGQYRIYRQIDRVLAVSSAMRDAITVENPTLGKRAQVCGYPINWKLLSQPLRNERRVLVTIGYVGRINREKGLDLFVETLARLAQRSDLPPWRVLLCGPHTVAQGGSGEEYFHSLETKLAQSVAAGNFRIIPPQFEESALADMYREIDIFCYPSLAERGETFGVAVAEAMAAGAVPVVSNLPCFQDFVTPGVNGQTFDHQSPEAAQRCAELIANLLLHPDQRNRLAAAARETVQRYDFPTFAERLLADFSALK